jgi:hypothetical protein
MGGGVIPGNLNGADRMPVDHGLQHFGDLPATFAPSAQHHGCTRMIIDGTQPIPLIRLAWRGNHDVLTPKTPHRAQGRQPAHIECVRIVERLPGGRMIAGLFNRLVFTAYSGSGLLIWCWGWL